MASRYNYSRERFARALRILSGKQLPRGWPDTPKNRLRWAMLEVTPCTPHHFASAQDYSRYALLAAELRDHSSSWDPFDAIDSMALATCEQFSYQLAAIAEAAVLRFSVVKNPASEPAEPAEFDGRQERRA
jgi:hypothetical protein